MATGTPDGTDAQAHGADRNHTPSASAAPRGRWDREALETVLRRRFFFAPAFEIYGGVAGLYDYGPPGCAMKNNLVQMWRQHFVLEEGMLELDGPALTPDPVLRTSGHVDKFQDWMVRDTETAACYRADHLLRDALQARLDDPTLSAARSSAERQDMEHTLAHVDELTADELAAALRRFDVRAPDTNHPVSAPYSFNLMFQTQIGPTGTIPAYLRPETAQGMFVNFRRLLDYVGGRMPFACAQIGLAYRNEISPRAGLLRVREFMQAEIEHFVHPERKAHPRFHRVAEDVLVLFPRDRQSAPPDSERHRVVRMRAGEAVAAAVIDNQTLAYFMARTQSFAYSIGMRPEHLRFRQHLANEMAHYARDCWDLEVETSYGWIECVGLADRACYDLKAHSEVSKVELVALYKYDEPRTVQVFEAVPVKRVIGQRFKRDAQRLIELLQTRLDEAAKLRLHEALQTRGSHELDGFTITPDMVEFQRVSRTVHSETYYPSVIEPSFGIGRLLYCVLEHAFYVRAGDDEARAVLRLVPAMAPLKCAVLPLSKNEAFEPLLQRVSTALTRAAISFRADDSNASIGKRYARADELGIPFGITIDFDSVSDATVTVRERDSMQQLRGDLEAVVQAIADMCRGEAHWKGVSEERERYGLQRFEGQQTIHG